MNYIFSILTFSGCALSYLWLKTKLQALHYSQLKANVLSIMLTITMFGTGYTISTFSGFSNLIFTLLLVVWILIYFKWKPKFPKITFVTDSKWYILILLSIIVFILHHQKWGGWDAWAIWNMHAKFMLDQNNWQNMFAPKMEWSHPDYPLLLPSTIAMMWKATTTISPAIPAIIALTVYLCINTLLFDYIKSYRFSTIMVLGSLILGYDYVDIASAEYADSVIALSYLIVIILLHEKPGYYLPLVGIFCGMAISLKNEGIVFYVLVLIFIMIKEPAKIKSVIIFLCVSLPFVLALFYLKWFLAPSNDIISGQSIITFERILSPYRYFHIIRFGLETLFAKYYMLLIVFALTFRYRSSFPPEIWIILWVLLAYLTVYLITPRDLIWHLSTSMKRLYYHLYPSTLYLILASTDLKKWEEYLETLYIKYLKKPLKK